MSNSNSLRAHVKTLERRLGHITKRMENAMERDGNLRACSYDVSERKALECALKLMKHVMLLEMRDNAGNR